MKIEKNMENKFYITTPIYYANGSPHIGHALTTIITDVLARYNRKKIGDENVYFTTGIDEHGTTVEQAALKEGYTRENFQKYLNKRATEWQKAFDAIDIKYDYFVRTTNNTHKKFAQDFIKKMIDNGDVYKGAYEGSYCWGCEKFLTLSDQNEKGLCPLHRKDQVEKIKESNYFFKLSKYAPKIKKLIENETIKIVPNNKAKEMIARLDEEIEDLSISRPKQKVSWGVEFPEDSEQTVYVWVEALINYLSSLEINNKQEFWKNTTHMLGKDINWFHNVLWPAFLLSAGYSLYEKSFVHSFLTANKQKISKSLGNVIALENLIEKYGIDGTRFLILSNYPYKDDSDVTANLLDEQYNANLANGLGNTFARITKLAQNSNLEFEDTKISDEVFDKKWADPLEKIRVDLTLSNIWERLAALDKHINANEPWAITDKGKLKEILQFELDELRTIAVIIEPFLPNTAKKMQTHLKGPKIKGDVILFPRIKD